MPSEAAGGVSSTTPSSRGGRGATAILVSTAIAGVLTYVLQAGVLSVLNAADYLHFSVMWSVLYLVIGALAGIQQEVARGARPARERAKSSGAQLVWFGLAAGMSTFALVGISGVLWGPLAIPTDTATIVTLVAAGAGAYVCVAVLSGTMYGLHRWKTLAALIAVDAALRLAFVLLAINVWPSLVTLAVAIVVPFPLTFALVWLFLRTSLRGRIVLDVGVAGLTWNSMRTVLGCAATAVMVSGFPFFLGVSSAGQTKAAAAVVAVVTLTRAPLVIPVLALQSFMVVHFRDLGARLTQRILLILGGLVAVSAVAGLLALWIGLDVLRWFGADLQIQPAEIAWIVFSAGFTGALCVTGSAALARGNHSAFTTGWVLGAAIVIATLFLPLEPAPKSIIALVVGPVAGLVAHFVLLRRTVNAGADESQPAAR